MASYFAVYKHSHLSSEGRRMYSCSSGKVLPSWLQRTMQAQTFGSHGRIHTDQTQ